MDIRRMQHAINAALRSQSPERRTVTSNSVLSPTPLPQQQRQTEITTVWAAGGDRGTALTSDGKSTTAMNRLSESEPSAARVSHQLPVSHSDSGTPSPQQVQLSNPASAACITPVYAPAARGGRQSNGAPPKASGFTDSHFPGVTSFSMDPGSVLPSPRPGGTVSSPQPVRPTPTYPAGRGGLGSSNAGSWRLDGLPPDPMMRPGASGEWGSSAGGAPQPFGGSGRKVSGQNMLQQAQHISPSSDFSLKGRPQQQKQQKRPLSPSAEDRSPRHPPGGQPRPASTPLLRPFAPPAMPSPVLSLAPVPPPACIQRELGEECQWWAAHSEVCHDREQTDPRSNPNNDEHCDAMKASFKLGSPTTPASALIGGLLPSSSGPLPPQVGLLATSLASPKAASPKTSEIPLLTLSSTKSFGSPVPNEGDLGPTTAAASMQHASGEGGHCQHVPPSDSGRLPRLPRPWTSPAFPGVHLMHFATSTLMHQSVAAEGTVSDVSRFGAAEATKEDSETRDDGYSVEVLSEVSEGERDQP